MAFPCLHWLSMGNSSASMLHCNKPVLSNFPLPLDGGPYGRAPKGDGGLNSRACLRIQFTYWVGGLMVEPACA